MFALLAEVSYPLSRCLPWPRYFVPAKLRGVHVCSVTVAGLGVAGLCIGVGAGIGVCVYVRIRTGISSLR